MDTNSISIRTARPEDFTSLWQIAALDSASVPRGPLLVADVGGDVVAALSLPSGEAVADPFRRTAEAVALLRMRADQLPRESERPRGLLRRLRGRPAAAPG
jgi:hypothetical protein